MKTISTLILLAITTAGNSFAADEIAVTTNTPLSEVAPAAEVVSATTNGLSAGTNGGLRFTFRQVPLEMVLNYLSDAAGFIIVLDAQPRGKVDMWSNTPLTKDEAVDLLNSVLNKNGLASIRNGRTLTIVNKDEAKTRNIPVKQGSDPDGIPNNDEIVTQILPVRFVEVTQLIKDLQPLVATATTMTANEAGNSIVMTDTQANIRRVAEIIQAIDQGAEDVTEVEVFSLQYADPTEMATLLTSVFPDESRGGSSQSPVQFGRGGGNPFQNIFGGRGGRDGGNNSGGGGDQNSRIKKRARVIAVADARTQSVIVSAASGLMAQIRGMITQLDANKAKQLKVVTYSLENADADQVGVVLQELFETTNTRNNNNRNSQNRNNALQNRATQQGQQNGNTGVGGNRGGNRTGGGLGTGGF